MGYSTVTSFRRLDDAAQILRSTPSEHTIAPVNKWQVLRELTAARHAFHVTDRDLRVLQALLSFHPSDTLDAPHGLIIYPSNNAICERLHEMPCSSMRRHLAKLIDAGLMTRQDSPNGKRYTRRSVSGIHAFGFDLAPLALRFSEIQNKAQEARIQIERLRDLRETVSLMRRDLIGLVEYHRPHGNLEPLTAHTALANRIGNDLRRKLTEDELIAREQELHTAVKALHEISPEPKAIDSAELSTSPVENEQHYQNHIKERKDSEPRPEKVLQRTRPEASLGRVDKRDSAGRRPVIQDHLYVGDDLGAQSCFGR